MNWAVCQLVIGKYHSCVGLQVKEYLDNLGVEYRLAELFGRMSKVLTKYFRFGCYHEKDPAACHLLGDYWEGIKKDFIKVFYSNWFSIGLLYPGLTDLHHQL